MSAAFSAIMIVGALVLPDTSVGHHRGVDHAQTFDAVNPQLRIDDAIRALLPIFALPTG